MFTPDLSVVIPVDNEDEVLPLLVERLRPVPDGMDATYEVIAVDDGSTDNSAILLQRYRREWPDVRILRLRANAGHQAAISAGLAAARGDYAVTLDADLQDPPATIAETLAVATVVRFVLFSRWIFAASRPLAEEPAQAPADLGRPAPARVPTERA